MVPGAHEPPKVMVCMIPHSRPLINRKPEEKTCGEGPSLEAIFDDDTHLQDISASIQVHLHNYYVT